MKTLVILSTAFIIFGLSSCNQIDPAPFSDSDQSARMVKLDKMLQEHAWTVNFFWNAGSDQTGELSGYIFEFRGNGTVKAGNGSDAQYGTWFSDNEHGASILTIKFREEGSISAITRSWIVAEMPFRESNMLKLEHMVNDKRDSYFLDLESL